MARITKSRQAEIDAARTKLRELCPKGTKIYTVLRHVSRSGMARHIDVYVMDNCEPRRISGLVADALDFPTTDRWEIKVGGCGMDMGFHIVNSLSSALYCNEDGSYSHEGAYSLKHEWM